MSPEEREKKRRWMMEYNRRRKASAAKATQLDLDALNAIYGTRFRHGQQVGDQTAGEADRAGSDKGNFE